MDINSVISGVSEYARSNRYKVEILPPNVLINGTEDDSSDDTNYFEDLLSSFKDEIGGYITGSQEGYGDQRAINLSCSAVSMPSVSYATKDIRQAGGPLHKIPYDKIFEPITATFYVDINYNSRRFFIDWMNIIDKPSVKGASSNGNHYQFYDNFIGGMLVYQLDMNQFPSHVIEFEEMYPTQVSEIALGYENSESIATFTVTFTYRSWKQKKVNRLASTLIDNVRDFI